MSFSKKLLSGFLAIGLFSGVSSVRALDQIYFSELSEFQKIVMPPGTCDIELATLPSFYRYLQSLFFLTVTLLIFIKILSKYIKSTLNYPKIQVFILHFFYTKTNKSKN